MENLKNTIKLEKIHLSLKETKLHAELFKYSTVIS